MKNVKIGSIYSYRNGEIIIKGRYKKTYDNLIYLLRKSPFYVKDKVAGKRANTVRHTEFVNIFSKYNWSKGAFKKIIIDAYKEFPVEFEMSNLFKTLQTIVKLNELYKESKIDVGVIVVYDKTVKKTIRISSVPTIERVSKNYLSKFHLLFDCPLLIISIICGDVE